MENLFNTLISRTPSPKSTDDKYSTLPELMIGFINKYLISNMKSDFLRIAERNSMTNLKNIDNYYQIKYVPT